MVDVVYAALNFFDTLIIEGKYQLKPEPPFSPAGEFAGRVAAVGPGVAGFAVGDRVMGSTGFGAAREQIAIAANRLAHVPAGLPLDKAAGLSIAYGTTLHALKQRAEMKPGESLVVLGASGGVGLAAVEIGKAMGARVIACASSDDKLAFARGYGAAETINYATEDFRARLKALTGGKGVDVVYDPVGGPLTEAGAALARLEGTASGDRLRLGRDPEAAAQPHAAQGLRHPRRLLGRVRRARAGSASRQHVSVAFLGGIRRIASARSREISDRGLPQGVRGDLQAAGSGQGSAATRKRRCEKTNSDGLIIMLQRSI